MSSILFLAREAILAVSYKKITAANGQKRGEVAPQAVWHIRYSFRSVVVN